MEREHALLEWSDLAVILAVCRAGSLSGAARMLRQHHSTVFRRINAIEERTRVRFFERLPHGYEMTEAGQLALHYGERVEAEFHALGREVLGQDARLQGKVRVTAPQGLSEQVLPRLLAEFRRLHPGISIELVGAHSAMDLARREADVAIRATRKPPDASLGRKVCDFRFAVYAAPSYLEGGEDLPLSERDWCLIHGLGEWLVPLIWSRAPQCEERTVFTASDSLAVMNAAAEGMGATLMPCYLGDPFAGLVRVGEPIEELRLDLWVLTHADLRHTARVKALTSFLYDALARDSALFEGRAI